MQVPDGAFKYFHFFDMIHCDEQLKAALAKMLPDILTIITKSIWWSNNTPEHPYPILKPVLDTELLHLCWMVEETLNEYKSAQYSDELIKQCSADAKNTAQPNNWSEAHATWQQRVVALSKVKGIEI